MSNPFFKNEGPFEASLLCQILNIDSNVANKDILDIKDLFTAEENDLTFFHSKKYKDVAKKTRASFCITSDNLTSYLPDSCKPLIVKNVLVSTSKVTQKFYPSSINDNYDNSVNDITETNFSEKVNHGKNVLIGKNVSIGNNCLIGHNTIICLLYTSPSPRDS